MRLSESEKISLKKLAKLLHKSGLTAKEAEILMRMMGSIENIESWLTLLEGQSRLDKETAYLTAIQIMAEEDSAKE